MRRAVVFAVYPGAAVQAFSPIWWGGHPNEGFVMAPKAPPSKAAFFLASTASPSRASSADASPEPPQELKIWQQSSQTVPSKTPYFTVRADHTIVWESTGLCLDASSGDLVYVSHCTGGPSQLWNCLPWGHGGSKQIQLHGSNSCLAVNEQNGLNGAPVEIQECQNKLAQSWSVEGVMSPTQGPSTWLAQLAASMHHARLLFIALIALVWLSISARLWMWQAKSCVAVVSQGSMPLKGDHNGVSLRIMMAMDQGQSMEFGPSEDRDNNEIAQRSLPPVDMVGTPLVATFGFGSNSVRQLRGRLGDSALLGYPARIHDVALAFAGPNRSWAHDDDGSASGTATLIPLVGERVLGTICFLSEPQLEKLDVFEGRPFVYDRRDFHGEIFHGGMWHELPVVAYIKVNSAEWYPPSEAYRCAAFRNLHGSFPSLQGLVVRDTAGDVREHWTHPGYANLCLGAFLFEVGVRRREPWQLPRDIGQVKKKLESVALEHGIQLTGAVAELPDVHRLLHAVLSEEEFEIALRLLGASTSDSAATRMIDSDWSEDEAQAEQAPSEKIVPAATPASYLLLHNVGNRENWGLLLRSAAAFNVKEVLVVGRMQVSKLGSLRGSQGTSRHVDVRKFVSLEECKCWLRDHGIRLCGVEIVDGARSITEHPFVGSTCFMLGNEGTGMSDRQKEVCDDFVYIPQYSNAIACLNAAVAGSIVFQNFAVWAKYDEAGRTGEQFDVVQPRSKLDRFENPTEAQEAWIARKREERKRRRE